MCVLRRQDRTLVDDESQEAVVKRSFNQFDEEGLSLDDVSDVWPGFNFSKKVINKNLCITILIVVVKNVYKHFFIFL